MTAEGYTSEDILLLLTRTLMRTSKCQPTNTHTRKHTFLNGHDSGISSFQGGGGGE